MKAPSHMPAFVGICLCICMSLAGPTTAASALQLNGASDYSDLGKSRFLAALYLELPSSSYDSIINFNAGKRMEMRLTSRYSKRRWVNLWMQGIAISNNNRDFNDMTEALVELFNNQQGGLQPGDVVALNFDAENGCSYEVNGVTLASELPGDLFKLFVNTWIGKVPPTTDFRDKILGKDVDTTLLAVKLDDIAPSEDRVAAIEEWIAPEEPKELPVPEEQQVAEEQPAPGAEELAASEEPNAEETVAATEPAIDAPVQVGLFSGTENDPIANALAATALLEQQQQAAVQQTLIEEVEPEPSISVESILAMKEYTKYTKREIYKSIKYPTSALRSGHEGQVRVQLQVARNGELLNVEASQESKYRSLNRAAIKAVKKAAPYKILPEAIGEDPLELSIPITFKLVAE